MVWDQDKVWARMSRHDLSSQHARKPSLTEAVTSTPTGQAGSRQALGLGLPLFPQQWSWQNPRTLSPENRKRSKISQSLSMLGKRNKEAELLAFSPKPPFLSISKTSTQSRPPTSPPRPRTQKPILRTQSELSQMSL